MSKYKQRNKVNLNLVNLSMLEPLILPWKYLLKKLNLVNKFQREAMVSYTRPRGGKLL